MLLLPALLYDASIWREHPGWCPVTCCSTVGITSSRCDLCAVAGSRVEHGYTIIRPYAMHCVTDREAENGRGLRILRRSESWLEGSQMSGK